MRRIYEKWMAATQREKMKRILEEIGTETLERKRILDVGSGPGFLGKILRGRSLDCFIVSCDIHLQNLGKAEGLKVLASGNRLPFKKAFDIVFCIDTVHLLDRKRIANEFASVLRDNEMLIVSAFCSKYNTEEKMKELESIFSNFKIEKEFFVKTEREWDAVVVARLK